MENEREHSGKYPLPKFGLLDHYLINLFSREENRDDVKGVIKELFKHIPDYGQHIEDMKHIVNAND